MSDSTKTQEIGWRLRFRMAENGIASAVELQERLAAVGYEISSAQLSRIVDKKPEQVKIPLLEALLAVLGGTLEDLMPIEQRPGVFTETGGAMPINAPRVEAVIDAVMERYPGTGPAAQLRYYEAVHQELAPLARDLERETAIQSLSLENIRLFAARHRQEGWGQQILKYCEDAGCRGSPLRQTPWCMVAIPPLEK